MEYDINNISDLTSREYFQDVLQSFYSKNYRSSILLLYSLTINDMYKKLIYMNDNGLFDLKSEIEKINRLSEENEVKYSEIERKVYTIYKEKKILNKTTIDMLDYLIKVRDKCAHPIFSGEDEYYSPTMDETRWLISKCYLEIISIDAYIKEPYAVLKNSLENNSWDLYVKELFGIHLNDEEVNKFKKFYENKYFSKMTDMNYIKLFKSLIDMIFRKNNEDSIKHQYIRFKLLEALLKHISQKGKIDILKNTYNWSILEKEKIYDTIPHDPETCQNLSYFYKLLLENPIFIKEVKDENEFLFDYMKNELDKNVWYLVKYYLVFYENLETALYGKNESYSYYKIVLSNCGDVMSNLLIIELLTKMFKKIPDFNGYDMADEMCATLIDIIENRKLTTSDIKEILRIMNDNRQIYDISRNGSKKQMNKLKLLNIDLSNYENLGSD